MRSIVEAFHVNTIIIYTYIIYMRSITEADHLNTINYIHI